jgi:hypothetical protein
MLDPRCQLRPAGLSGNASARKTAPPRLGPGTEPRIGYTERMPSPPATPVNYESPALLEIEIDGTDYRMDSGKQGTALCISTRPSGTWDWTFGGEARWEVNYLRSKAFDRRTLEQLSRAFAQALENMD